jgi:hypothetical protein
MVGARAIPGNSSDDQPHHSSLEQVEILLEGMAAKPKLSVVNRGCRGVDADIPTV